MLKTALFTIFSTVLTCCGGSTSPTERATPSIPYPSENEAVEQGVANLLQRTASELAVDPEDPKRWVLHASALFANEYYEPSIEAYKTALRINPEMPHARYIKSIALWRLNRQEEALSELQLALALIPEYAPGWRLLAEGRLQRGESLLAEEAARRAFELNPQLMGTRYILALSLLDTNQANKVVELLEPVVDRGQTPPWIFDVLAKAYRELGQQEKMKSAFAKAGPPLEHWPDPLLQPIYSLIAGKVALTEYALWAFKNGSPQEALPILRKAFRMNPTDTNLRVASSIALQATGKLDDALRLLKEINSETNANYWKQYAHACFAKAEQTGDNSFLERGKKYIDLSLSLDPNDGSANDVAAIIALKQERIEEAIGYWEKAGNSHIEEGMWKSAELSLAYAVENGSTNGDTLRNLAQAQIRIGNFVQAQTTINTLLEVDANDEIAIELKSSLPQ